MPARLLAVLEQLHRGAVESQFGDVLYVARELHRQFGLDLALRGTAVTAALAGPGVQPVQLGPQWTVEVPDGGASVRTLLADGVTVYADCADLDALGLSERRLLPGVQPIDAAALAARWPGYERVWFL
jgi:hypothetical protein